ncbi:MAG TPA: NADH-quinone oxidoreductase subunit NuoE [Symbiobacteriaceae bacterium]|nr:NADH-quinone oxidoreductase subunit NuoE [Symbiobacteriaceae bacterium]
MSVLLNRRSGDPGKPVPAGNHVVPAKVADLKAFLAVHAGRSNMLIPALQHAQALFGYVPPEAMFLIAERLSVPYARVYGVATFYAQFRLQPAGRRTVRVCMGTACHVRGASSVLAAWSEALDVKPGATTTDGEVTLEQVSCLGACGLAPTVMVDATTHGRLTPGKVKQVVAGLKKE